MSSSHCCFLICIQISQEAGQVVWYSHLFQNFPHFTVIHMVNSFGIVSKAEIDVFWNSFAFLMIQRMFEIWCQVPLPFLKPAWTSGSSRFTYCWRQRNQRSNCQHSLDHRKSKRVPENIYFCFIDYAKAFDCVDHNKLWKILQEMRILDHLTWLLRNQYAGQEATVRTGHGPTDWFQIGKGVC